MIAKTKYFTEFAEQNHLQFDTVNKMAFGQYKGFDICILRTANAGYQIFMKLKNHMKNMDKNDFKELKKSKNGLFLMDFNENGLMVFNAPAAVTEKGAMEKLQMGIDGLVDFLRENGYKTCCAGCETESGLSAYSINGRGVHLCENCYASFAGNIQNHADDMQEKSENVVFGSVGALLGSLVGVLSIVVIGQLGYVAAISGVILAVCTLKGYEKFGGKLSKMGVMISIAIMAAMVIFGNRLDWAVAIAMEFDQNIFDAFAAVSDIVDLVDARSDYNLNLFMIGIFALVGSFSPIKSAFINPHNTSKIRKLEANRLTNI